MISNVSVLVRDYDQAIDFYVNKMGFTLLCDVPVTTQQRWIRVAPQNNAASGTALVLTLAKPEQQHLVGKQAGEGVFLFLHSDDFWADYRRMQQAGVTFLEQPREEIYATVVVFRDSEGNSWDLLQTKN